MYKYRKLSDDSVIITEYINNKNLSGCIIPSYYEGKKVKFIGISSFQNERHLKKVAFSPFITEIGRYAFKNSFVIEFIFNHELSEIRDKAFQNNYYLRYANLQDTKINYIGNAVFSSCIVLEEFILPTETGEIGIYVCSDCENLKRADVSSLYVLPTGTFYKCISLTDVKVNPLLEKIKAYCFYQNKCLIGFTIPNTVAIIEKYALFETGIIEFIAPSNLSVMGKGCLKNCSSLKIVDFSKSKLKKIESELLSGCNQVYLVKLPESLREIKDYVFSDCDSLSSVYIPNTVDVIDVNAFMSKTKKQKMNITIVCDKGSYAEKFAKKYKLKYKILEKEKQNG